MGFGLHDSSKLLNFSSSFYFHGSCLHAEVRFGTQAWAPRAWGIT
jgi:hypothetical protein